MNSHVRLGQLNNAETPVLELFEGKRKTGDQKRILSAEHKKQNDLVVLVYHLTFKY